MRNLWSDHQASVLSVTGLASVITEACFHPQQINQLGVFIQWLTTAHHNMDRPHNHRVDKRKKTDMKGHRCLDSLYMHFKTKQNLLEVRITVNFEEKVAVLTGERHTDASGGAGTIVSRSGWR